VALGVPDQRAIAIVIVATARWLDPRVDRRRHARRGRDLVTASFTSGTSFGALHLSRLIVMASASGGTRSELATTSPSASLRWAGSSHLRPSGRGAYAVVCLILFVLIDTRAQKARIRAISVGPTLVSRIPSLP